MNEPLPPLPEDFWEYILDINAPFDEKATDVCTMMIRDGYATWKRNKDYEERIKTYELRLYQDRSSA